MLYCRDIVKVLSVKCNLSEEEVVIIKVINASVIINVISVIIIVIVINIIKVIFIRNASAIISVIIIVMAIFR